MTENLAATFHKLLSLVILLFSYNNIADITINYTQADKNGISIDELQKTLRSATESELIIDNNKSNYFASNFDLISLDPSKARAACRTGKLIDLSNIQELTVLLKKKNFLFKSKNKCAFSYAMYSMVIAYPIINLVTTRPQSIADLFDLDRFPGTRALPDSPIATLEWALMSYGIPRNEVYDLLSTQRGLKLAFARLDKIKRHIIWWKTTDELKTLISNNQVSLAAGPHSIFYEIEFIQPMEIVWQGQLLVEMQLGINAASLNQDQSITILKDLMSDSVQFELAYQFSLGPVNKQTLKTLSILPQSGQVLPFIPTLLENMDESVWLDHNWHEILKDKISNRFRQWRIDGEN